MSTVTAEREVRNSVVREGLALLEAHGLTGWRVRVTDLGRHNARCNHRDKVIEIAIDRVFMGDRESLRNTLLHEVAHALTPGQGHNEVWRRKAVEIGCTGERTRTYRATVPQEVIARNVVRAQNDVCPSCWLTRAASGECGC